MAAVERVVRHALFSYVDPKGVTRMAVRGDRIRLDGDELARAERFEAVVAEKSDLDEELEAIAAAEAKARELASGVTPVEVEGPESSPAGAQDDDDEPEDDDLAIVVTSDGVEHVGVLPASAADEGDDETGDDEEEDLDGPKAPPKAGAKDLWVDYRFAQQDGRLSREQLADLKKEQLQDDAFIAGLQPTS